MIRGIEEKHEHAAQRVARDTRPLGIRVAEFLAKPQTIFVIGLTSAVCAFIFPVMADVIGISFLFLFLFLATRKNTLPYRIPKSAKVYDYNDCIPGTTKPKMSGGISFIGNDRKTREELWFTNDDMRTHMLMFGSTGSGKTEALVSIAFNSLIHASGFIYVDGKGDNSLFAKVFSMVRGMGRDDDMLLINFMTGARDVIGPQRNRLSNTMNPFSCGSSSMLSQLIVSLMDAGSNNSSGGDMWKGRAMNFVESLMKILTAMRDAGHILLDANSIRDYFILEKLEMMVVDKRFPVTDDYSIPLDTFPPQIIEPLKNYVLNLPGYNPKKKGDQASEVREQHGFITMQLTRVFGSLADTYGHIIRTNLAEVDLKDVVLNRRILVVLLPALEKSPEELANLGKVIIASLKAMMAAGLGDTVEGDYRDVVLRKPTNSPSPYVCIMDEYGYYAVQGFAVVPAQARSLGFSAIFAGQDLPAFQKASKEEAASIGANCNVKICMKLEDPQETWEFFNKVAGESYVTNVSGFQVNSGSMSLNYMDSRNASVDRRSRIELLDLKDQREGEAHVFFKSKIIRAEMFYANPKPVKKMRINHFLKVEPPPPPEIDNLVKRLRKFRSVFTEDHPIEPTLDFNEDISTISDSFMEEEDLQPFERGIAALVSVLEGEVEKQKELGAPYEMEEPIDFMSAFTKIPLIPIVEQMIGKENIELFNLPLLRRGSTLEELKHIERLTGNNDTESTRIANEIIKDIENVTSYPPEVLFTKDREQFFDDVNVVIEALGGNKVEQPEGFGLEIDKSDRDYSDSEDELDIMDDEPVLPELPDLSELEDFANIKDRVKKVDEYDEDEDEIIEEDQIDHDENENDESEYEYDYGDESDEDNEEEEEDEEDEEDEDDETGSTLEYDEDPTLEIEDETKDQAKEGEVIDSEELESEILDSESDLEDLLNMDDIDELPDLPDIDELERLLKEIEEEEKKNKDSDDS